jgi:branched-chain amino acid transport system ATP-binding protein
MENLVLATWQRKDRSEVSRDYDRVFALFPRLAARRQQQGGTLSGGEQQMLAVARAMMSRGRLLLLDEPSMGLSPLLVRDIFDTLVEINRGGTTILLVEQNANMALRVAARGYLLETGAVTLEGSGKELLGNPRVREAYLGGTG